MKSANNTSALKLKYSDFQVVKILGYGAYGKVQLVKFNGKEYALKIIEKRKLQKEGKQYMAFVQRQVLMKLDNPGIIKLIICFQDPKNVYYLLEYCQGGNLKSYLQQNYNVITNQIRQLYIAQLVKIIEYLQSVKIVHRDIKPQNILIHSSKHIKINDFGTTQYQNCDLISDKFKEQIEKQKQFNGLVQPQVSNYQASLASEVQKLSSSSEGDQNYLSIKFGNLQQVNKRRKATFVGTCNYLPPQLLQLSECGFASDIWALGCVIYQMYYGYPPFDADNQYQIFQKIKQSKLQFPKNQQVDEIVIDLISRLLMKNPEDRLGCNSRPGLMFSDLQKHEYFKNIDFETYSPQNYPIPQLKQQTNQNNSNKSNGISKTKTSASIMSQFIKDSKQNKQDIIYEGIVEKRTFINYNRYYLTLMKNLTIYRIKVNQPQKQCKIKIKKQLPIYTYPAQIIQNNIFSLISEDKTYKFRTDQAEKWVDQINNLYTLNLISQISIKNQIINSKNIKQENIKQEQNQFGTECESKKSKEIQIKIENI